MKTKTFPFVGPPNQRDTSAKDRRYINVLFETIENQAGGSKEVYCLKRPGLVNDTQPPGGTSTGRGIKAWGATGNIYSVFNNMLYSGTTSMIAMSTSTGRVYFEETPAGAGAQLLIVSDGQDNYNITTADAVTQIDASDDIDFPGGNLGPVYYLDGFLFQAQSDGDVWNTNLNSFTSWNAANFLRTARRGDDLEAIHLQKDQLIAFGKNSIEFYYNAGNPFGSPLLRVEQNAIDFGIAAKETLAWSGENALFVAENSARGDGGRSVWSISGLGSLKEISTPPINRFLKAEGLSISSATAWMERVAGQVIYVLNLAVANSSFVYQVEDNHWLSWEAAGGGRFPGVSATSLNGLVYVQDASNGRIYKLDTNTFRDSGSDFNVVMQTERLDFGTGKRKKMPDLEVVADTNAGTLSVANSDDDFGNFTSSRPIDMSLTHKRLARWSAFRERAFRFTYAENSSFRAQAYRVTYEEGQS